MTPYPEVIKALVKAFQKRLGGRLSQKNHRTAEMVKIRGETMNTVKELEKAVTDLSPEQLAEFRAWYEAFDAAMWDKQFEDDVKSGKLDRVAEKAVADYRKGKTKPL